MSPEFKFFLSYMEDNDLMDQLMKALQESTSSCITGINNLEDYVKATIEPVKPQPQDFLMYGWEWSGTDEGHDFWGKIHKDVDKVYQIKKEHNEKFNTNSVSTNTVNTTTHSGTTIYTPATTTGGWA